MNFKKLKRCLSVVLSATMILSSNMTGFAAEITADPAAPAEESQVQEPAEHEHQWQLVESLKGIERYACIVDGCTATKNEVAQTADETEETKSDEATNEELSREPYENNYALEADGAVETGTAKTAACPNHNIGSMESRVAPTCFTEGTAAHYHCAACDKYYRTKADAEAQENPVTLDALKIQKLNHNAVLEGAVEPTCTTDGHAEYYTCAICKRVYETMEDLYNDVENKTAEDSTCLSEEEIAAKITKTKLGHSYKRTDAEGAETRTVVFNGWNSFDPTSYKEGTACGITASRTCSREGCTYSQTATMVSVQKGNVTDFDCTAGDELTYTATATFTEENGNESEANTPTTETDPHPVTIDGHKYTYQFTWPTDPNTVLVNKNGKLDVSDTDKVTVTRACNVCEAPAVDADTAEATLTSDGITIGEYSLKCYAEEKAFTATATLDDHTETDVKTLTLPVGEHDFVFHKRTEPTCTKEGNYEYYSCVDCHKNFWDAGTEIDEETEQINISPLGHNIGLPVYSFVDGTDMPKATFSCIRAAGENGCGVVIEKTADVTVDLASVRPTDSTDTSSCGDTTSLTYDTTVKFDRNTVKFDTATNQWYEDTSSDSNYAPITYNGTVTREGVMPHKFTADVQWVDAGDTTTEAGKTIYDPKQGIKATLTCTTCKNTVKMASEGVSPDTGDITLKDGSVLALGEIDTGHKDYHAANCSTGGHDVYHVTITGTTDDNAATPIAITDAIIETDTAKSGHKYIITNLTEGTDANGDPIAASMTIECVLGNDCPDTKSGSPVNITYTPDSANGVTVTYESVNGTPEAGSVKEVSCTEDGVKVWAVDATIEGKKAYRAYAANGTGTRWTLQKEVSATGHDFTGAPEWDWSDYGTETDGEFLPFEGEGNKVHATYTCQNGNCGGGQHANTEPAADDTAYNTANGKRIKVVSVEPTNDKTNITNCGSGGKVTYTATAGNVTDTKTQTVTGHVWNTLQWGEWTYVLENGERTYQYVTIGTAPDQVTVKIPVKTITASRTCSICGGRENFAETADATDQNNPILGGITVTDSDTEPASCTRAGSTLYFATLEMSDGTVIKNTMPDIEVYKATGHNYDIQWTWYGQTEENGEEVEVNEANESQIIAYTAASAKKACQNAGCNKEFAGTKDKFPATCINNQNGVSCDKTDVFKYEATAAFTDDPDEEYSAQKMIVHEETGHDYEWTITNWTTAEADVAAGTYDNLTLHGVCKNNRTHHTVDLTGVTVTVAEDGITHSPETCSEKDSLVISGTFTTKKDNVDYSGTAVYSKPEEGGEPNGPHKYTAAEPVWGTLTEISRDETSVTFEMDAVVKCDHAATLADHNKKDVKITAVASLTDVEKIDCSENYTITYTMSIKGQTEDPDLADVQIVDKTTQDGVTAVVSHTAGSHSLDRVAGQEGSCTKPGWRTHYHCNVCGKNYSSYTADTEVLVEETEPLGHLYGDPTFEWLEEGSTARAIFTCTRSGCTTSIAGHTKAVLAEVNTDPKYVYRDGEVGCVDSDKRATDYYMVTVTENSTKYDGDLAVAVPPVDHSFTGTDGECIYCHKTGLVKVSFVYNNGTEDVSISDAWVDKNAPAISFPSAPNRPGYTFAKWSLDGQNATTPDEILAQTADGNQVTVKALYTAIKETGTVTVKYLNGSDFLEYAKPDNGDVYTGGIGKNVSVSVAATITVGGKTYAFSHWAKEAGGTTLGTSPYYDVYIASDVPVTVYAVYQQGTESPEAVPVVAMTNTYRYTEADGTNKLAFTTAMSIPDGYTMVESGILYGVDQTTFGEKETEELNAALVLNGASVFKKALNGTKTNLLSVKITAANESREVYARGYLMCENEATGIVEVYYTDSVHQNYTNASELTAVRTVK